MVGQTVSADLVLDPFVVRVLEISRLAYGRETERSHDTFGLLLGIVLQISRQRAAQDKNRSAGSVFDQNGSSILHGFPALRDSDLEAVPAHGGGLL